MAKSVDKNAVNLFVTELFPKTTTTVIELLAALLLSPLVKIEVKSEHGVGFTELG